MRNSRTKFNFIIINYQDNKFNHWMIVYHLFKSLLKKRCSSSCRTSFARKRLNSRGAKEVSPGHEFILRRECVRDLNKYNSVSLKIFIIVYFTKNSSLPRCSCLLPGGVAPHAWYWTGVLQLSCVPLSSWMCADCSGLQKRRYARPADPPLRLIFQCGTPPRQDSSYRRRRGNLLLAPEAAPSDRISPDGPLWAFRSFITTSVKEVGVKVKC